MNTKGTKAASQATNSPDAYLVDRGPSTLGHSFTLVPVHREGNFLVLADSERISVSDDQRFLYPVDVDRAVDRGIVSRGPDGISGPRYSGLAVFPLLRPRHLPDRARSDVPATATEESRPPTGQRPAGRQRRSHTERHEKRASDAGEAGDAAHPTVDAPPRVPDSAEQAHRPNMSTDHVTPPPLEEGEANTDVAVALAGVRATVERDQAPVVSDLELLVTDRAALQALLDWAANLKPEVQLRLAESVANVLMRHQEARAFLHVWMQTTADRLQRRANHLVSLVETWSCADAPAALAYLRAAQRTGAISFDQRQPRVVAEILRSLARDVGDSDALREAYLALARAPERRDSTTDLVKLLGELEAEETGTRGERRAIGLQILLRAFECAATDQVGIVGGVAARYAITFVREDPPEHRFGP